MADISFFDEPTAVYEYFKSKKPKLHFDYDEIMHDTHKRVFTVAKITKIDLLNDIKKSLEESFKQGKTFSEWKQNIIPTLKQKGWFGKTTVINPNTGEEKEIYVGSKRLKRIFDTNMRTSYAKARYESQMQSTGEYFRYTAVLDQKTRPAHSKLHGTVLPKHDPFWSINYPPNDWGCRCKVQVLTDSEVKKRNITPLTDSSFLKDVASKDFAYNPGMVSPIEVLDEVLEKKVKKFSQTKTTFTDSSVIDQVIAKQLKDFQTQRDLYVWQKGLDEMVDTIAKGDIIKDKLLQVAQVGELKSNVLNGLKILGIEPKAKSISIYQNTINHALRGSKPKSKEPNIKEIKGIVGVLYTAKHCYYDKKHKNIIYYYSSLKKDNMVNYISVNLDYILKKFKTDNFIISIGKITIDGFRSSLRDKKHIKLSGAGIEPKP